MIEFFFFKTANQNFFPLSAINVSNKGIKEKRNWGFKACYRKLIRKLTVNLFPRLNIFWFISAQYILITKRIKENPHKTYFT